MTQKDTSLSVEEVQKLATLSRIDISDTEAEKLGGDIGSILGYIQQIEEVVDETSQDDGHKVPTNVLREDSNPHETGIHKKELLSAASDSDADYVKVKNIL